MLTIPLASLVVLPVMDFHSGKRMKSEKKHAQFSGISILKSYTFVHISLIFTMKIRHRPHMNTDESDMMVKKIYRQVSRG